VQVFFQPRRKREPVNAGFPSSQVEEREREFLDEG
jgi:hypothetical protein